MTSYEEYMQYLKDACISSERALETLLTASDVKRGSWYRWRLKRAQKAFTDLLSQELRFSPPEPPPPPPPTPGAANIARAQRIIILRRELSDDEYRAHAVANGHEWWPCSKRALSDYPTECDKTNAMTPNLHSAQGR